MENTVKTNETGQINPEKKIITLSKMQQQSMFTALIYFKKEYAVNSGTAISSELGRKFHSWKQEQRPMNGNIIIDHKFALKCLREMITRDYNGKYKTALIYFNPKNELIEKYSYDMLRMAKEPITVPHGDYGVKIIGFR